MGRIANGGALAELPAAEFDLQGAATLMARAMDALRGASGIEMYTIKVPQGEGKQFEMPGDESARTFEGVILANTYVNAYWDHEFGEGDKSPNCESHDGISGWDRDGMEHVCATCPRNRMGSRDGGRGKACRNSAQLLVLIAGEPLPVRVQVPTMSLGNYQAYITRQLVPRSLQPWQVVTRISVVKDVNAKGTQYSKIIFEAVGLVDEEQTMALRARVLPLALAESSDEQAE